MSWQTLFPITAKANAANHLELGGCDLVDLAREFGTPLYVFDEATLRAQAEQARGAFRARWSDSIVLYATKAYFSPFLARLFRGLGLGLDVTSGAEMELARREGFSGDMIYVHGNNKTAAEIRAAIEGGIDHLVVDNLDEIPIIAAQAQSYGRTPRLLLRISPDIDPQTHNYLKTGTAGGKFGLGIESGMAARALEEIRRNPRLRLVGLHVHIGSQVFEPDALVRAMIRCLDLAAEWRAQYDFELQELSLGGGWGVAYTETQESLSIDMLAERLCTALRAALEERNLSSTLRLLVEPGRALVARAGVVLYRVGSIKSQIPVGQVSDERIYAAIDGGMGDNIRPALYGAQYTARAANKWGTPAAQVYAIAGRYCEQGDVLIDAVALPRLEPGDLLAVPNAGAYQLPMASNYNLIPRPAVVVVKEGRAKLVRRRETIDDMLACDVETDTDGR
jgi:diaminopimelate decarboxylase